MGFSTASLSYSMRNVVRGLHYQVGDPQGQMVTIVMGAVLDVLVDLRRGSPTFEKTVSVHLDADTPTQIYMPPGVAHGFCVLSDLAILHYKCTRVYDQSVERGLIWDDPDLAIDWPIAVPVISARDAAFPRLRDIAPDDLPRFGTTAGAQGGPGN